MLKYVIKNNGSEELFELGKMIRSIELAFKDRDRQYNDNIIDFLAVKASSNFETDIKSEKISSKNISKSIDTVLRLGGYEDVADSYLNYRHNKYISDSNTLIDYKKLVNDYLDESDWRVKENSTVTHTLGGLILSNSGAVTANYWLSEVYDEEIAEAHRNADIHIHDLCILSGYCAGWSLKQLIQEGLGGVPGRITSSPASHLATLCNQMVNFLGIMQNEWAGAQAFSSFDTYLAPFVKVDNLDYKQVKQAIQSFVFGVNTPSRWGTQAPFSNITLDWTVPADLKDMPAIVGGKEMDFTYGDCKKEMDMVNKAFIEIMIEGDAHGRGFQYPIPTYSITRDFDWSETENNKLLFEMTAKYGTPYFSNYVNSDMEPSDVRSMCLTPDTLVWARFNGKTRKCTIQYLYENADLNTTLILTKHGYRPIKEVQRFEYNGDMLKFTTDTGKTITSTLDHEHVVFDNDFNFKPSNLVKKRAIDLKIGEYFSCRKPNPGELRRGLTYEQAYGKEKSEKIKSTYREQRKGQWSGEKNPAFGGLNDTWRKNISSGLEGHYVSETCRRASSERWQGDKNPCKSIGSRSGGKQCCISQYEIEFAKELDALNIEYETQYYISKIGIGDFYIPSKNLIIELETDYRWDICSYNDTSNIHVRSLKSKYDNMMSLGYNVLVINPILDKSSYRKYINSAERIVSIETFEYCGYVYDLEVDCDEIDGDTTLYHTFYANDILTGNCCRLRLDLRELRKKSGGFFGSGESTGSVGVVTINLPRIAYLAENVEDFYSRLDKIMDIAARSLKVKREIITQLLDEGLYPYTKRYLGTFNNHFSTIGLIGMNEVGLNAKWLKKDLTNKETQEFAKDVLNHMRERLSDYQELYGDLYNLEATPAESTTYRLAKHDKKRYPTIITANENGTPYYTNSSHLPVDYTADIFEALDVQDELQTLYTSGTVFHAFLGEKLPDWKAAADIVRKIAENYRLPYYTISPTYSVCSNHGYITGEEYKCPDCGNDTEVYSRITGYYRPVQNFNDGKAQEFKDRKVYDIANSKLITKTIDESNDNNDISVSKHRELQLFATKTCPKCKIAAQLLDKANIKYEKLFVEDNEDLAKSLNLKVAPTLYDKSNNTLISDIGNIKSFINLL